MYDHEELRIKLEAMKMNQSSLQQLMTLSAGGLALYFSFIGKAPFLESLRAFGLLVVLSWITSLCCAAVAHRLHGNLFVSLQNLSHATRRVEQLEALPKETETQMKKFVDPKIVLDQALATIEEERKRFDIFTKAFETTYFPIQDRAIWLMSAALYSFVLGFVFLAAGYVIWTFIA